MSDTPSPELFRALNELDAVKVENRRLLAYTERLEKALEEIEAHHVEQNRRKGRGEERSTTLRIARAGLARREGSS